ncbi:MAG: hypothetical protein E7227_06280 [Clostridiales bacterium]|nr:hypothetical protein [Clostridiales bacterium]
MGKNRLRWYVNILLAVLVFGSWFSVFFFGTGSLVRNGLGSLKYFTMLSNIFVGVMAIAWLVSTQKGAGADKSGIEIAAESGNESTVESGKDSETAPGFRASDRVERLKYIAAASVGLTCATVLFFLGPIYGYPAMFSGFNLPLHLITPVIAILEIIFLSDVTYTRRDNLMVMIPPFLYGLGYIANILINGMGEWPDTNDWYLFFHWGYAVGALFYAVLLAVTWLIGLLMRKLQRSGK